MNELRVLRELLRERPHDGSDYLFTSQKGGRLDRSQFFRLFKAVAGQAGLPAEKRHPDYIEGDGISAEVSVSEPQLSSHFEASLRLVKWFAGELRAAELAYLAESKKSSQ